MSSTAKILVQCDFDNTVTIDDISFMLLDAFAEGNWHPYLEQYRVRQITVSQFNSRAFGLVRADERTMLNYLFTDDRVQIRPGFEDLVAYCQQHGIKFMVVSNGLKFYIRAILRHIGLDAIEVFAAESEFNPAGMSVRFIGPDGSELDACFKEAYTHHFLGQSYRVAYIGDGASDCSPASEANYIFARDSLLAYCREHKLKCTPLNDFYDVIRGLEGIS